MRQVFHYPFNTLNPYQSLLIKELKDKGVTAIAVPESGFRALLRTVNFRNASTGILHLHWLSGHITGHSYLVALLRAFLFVGIVLLWRASGGKVIWTVHNLVNHDLENLGVDRLLSAAISRLANTVTIFGSLGVAEACRCLRLKEEKVRVVKHGRYFEQVPFPPPRVENDTVHFLFFGLIRPYKGLDLLIQSFRRLFGENHVLTIAGDSKDTEYVDKLKHLAAGCKNIELKIGWLETNDLITELSNCDVVVLPFVETFMSGSLIAAVSAGRPVIVTDVGLVRDYVDEDAAFFFQARDKNSLEIALYRAAHDPDRQTRSKRILYRSREFSQTKIANQWISIYENLS